MFNFFDTDVEGHPRSLFFFDDVDSFPATQCRSIPVARRKGKCVTVNRTIGVGMLISVSWAFERAGVKNARAA